MHLTIILQYPEANQGGGILRGSTRQYLRFEAAKAEEDIYCRFLLTVIASLAKRKALTYVLFSE